MRKLFKLVVFFVLSFAFLFIAATGLRFLTLRVEWIRGLSPEQGAALADLVTSARWALSFTLYGGMLAGLSYIVRKKVFAPVALSCVVVLTLAAVWGVSLLVAYVGSGPSVKTHVPPLGKPGLILSNTIMPAGPAEGPGAAGTAIVLLEGPLKPGGSRVVATPGRSMLHQTEAAGRDSSLPPAPFINENPWFLRSIALDLRLSAALLWKHLGEGLQQFLIHTGSLVFFLGSLFFILKLSTWPLVNLFLSLLAFRGVLSLELFFDTPEMREVFTSYLKDFLPLPWAVPLLFCGVGTLVYLYSLLVHLIKGRSRYGY